MNAKRLYYWMPGLKNLVHYERGWLRYDLRAGLSVAAVALPTAIAYAELVGVGAIVGLYSCILPMIAYALFGSSRQLIVGPDTATCAVLAAVVVPLAGGDVNLLWQLAIVMSFMMGCWCLIASSFKLGALSDLLSQPILNGLLNGLSITIIVDQIPKIFGYRTQTNQLIEKLIEIPYDILNSHYLTVCISLLTLILLVFIRRARPGWPAPLFVVIFVAAVVWGADAKDFGVDTVESFSSSLPVVGWSDFQPGLMRDLVIPALNLALISFVSMMLTVRSFAAKNGYDVNADVEFRALGIINITSALSQGFVISGTSSRTAVNDSNGGKSQLVSIIAAVVIALVTLFLSQPLQYIPSAVLGMILIYSSYSLIDFRTMWQMRKRNREAFRLALFTLICVLLVGIIPGIGLAVLVGLIQFLRIVFRPTEQLLGINEEGMIHSLGNSTDVQAVPGVMMYRFNSPLTYFNAGYFKRRILNLVDGTPFQPNWVVIDAVASFTHADISVLAAIDELKRELKNRNVTLVLAGRRTELTKWFKDNRPNSDHGDLVIISDLYLALKFVQSKETAQDADGGG
jgi:high affinity sulfate transporter 1